MKLRHFGDNFLVSLKILAILCIVSCGYLLFAGTFSFENMKAQLFYNAFYGIPLCLVNGLFFDQLDDLLTWEKNARLRAWVGVIGSILLTMLTIFSLNYLLWVIWWGNEFDVLFTERNRVFYIIAFVITVVISAIVHAINFFGIIQEEKLINEKLRKEKAEMELSALKAHIDPHFLFNSFNTLSGLIDEDPSKAQKMLGELSGIYRYILEQRDEDINTIAAEMTFAKKYLALLQTRFEDSIELATNIDATALEQKIPTLSLQLLLENAIKHNAFDEASPLHIDITNSNGHLIIRNNKKSRKFLTESNGMGLQNIKDRYTLLTKQDIEIIDAKDSFTVKLPIIS